MHLPPLGLTPLEKNMTGNTAKRRPQPVTLNYTEVIEEYLQANPSLGKAALVELLMKRFSALSRGETWLLVSSYINRKA
jgi:hypothetical protein